MGDLQISREEREIARSLGCFARFLNAKKWSSVPDMIAHHLNFDYLQREYSGIAALENQMRKYHDVCGPTKLLLGSIIVDVKRDDAVGRIFDSTGKLSSAGRGRRRLADRSPRCDLVSARRRPGGARRRRWRA